MSSDIREYLGSEVVPENRTYNNKFYLNIKKNYIIRTI